MVDLQSVPAIKHRPITTKLITQNLVDLAHDSNDDMKDEIRRKK
jgi:hypothetical protein